MACSNDCWLREWLREDGPNSLGGDITNHNAEAHHRDSQPVMQPYEAARLLYKPIYLWQTRLIRLEPGSSGDPLRCELLTADITSTKEFGEGLGVHKYGALVEYTALSYCWGDKHVFEYPLHCGDIRVGLTENLASALYNLRLPNEPHFIWIDFLSINQYDNAEKGQHVQHMLRIYKKAKSVIVWLGAHSSSTYQAFRFLRETFNWERCQRELMDSTHSPDCLRQLQVSYHALQQLFRRPWFRRTWIRQEVFGARMVNVRCGSFVEHWDKFTRLLHSIIEVGGLQTPSDAVVQFIAFDTLDARIVKLSSSPDYMRCEDHSIWTQCGMWWLRVLLDGALYEVTDPRDRVYAHIGIARDNTAHNQDCTCNRNKFPIDYNKSLSVVYQDLVKHLINEDGVLAPLQICESRLDRNPDLPSWVTDFSRRMPRALIDRAAAKQTYTKPQDLSQLNKLTLPGRWVGTVDHIWGPDPASLRAGWFEYKGIYPRMTSVKTNFVHFGLDEDFDAFVDSGQYTQASVCPRKDLVNVFYFKSETRMYYERASVAEGVQRGDLILYPEGGDITFVVRNSKDQVTGDTVYTFLGPALYGPGRYEWTKLPVEEFVMI